VVETVNVRNASIAKLSGSTLDGDFLFIQQERGIAENAQFIF
jgi:hypothetical protein